MYHTVYVWQPLWLPMVTALDICVDAIDSVAFTGCRPFATAILSVTLIASAIIEPQKIDKTTSTVTAIAIPSIRAIPITVAKSKI